MHEQSTTPRSIQRAALYLRTGNIPEIQESDAIPLQTYAAQRGYQLVATYRDEGASGKDRDRPGLTQLLSDVARGRFDVVLVADPSRLASTPVEAQAVIEQIRRHGVAVESLSTAVPLAQPALRPPSGAGTVASGQPVDRARVRVGMEVLGADGSRVGVVKDVREADMWVDRTWQRDVYVPLTEIQTIAENRIVLDVIGGHVGNMGWEKPSMTG